MSATDVTYGKRATKLRQVLDTALDKTLNSVTLDAFVKCFPDYEQKHPSLLADLHKKFVTTLKENSMEEFGEICKEADIVVSLNKLEDLIANGNPITEAERLAQHKRECMEAKTIEKERLMAELTQMRSANVDLQRKLIGQRQKVREISASLTNPTSRMEQVVAASQTWTSAC
eukprot:GFYU01010335.1.p1 GENE.GFYU01010335.1~~GFYU01010335.1.p1  ORF type:complete len:173 (+),score=55.95 GFYU01010335.1:36-554(+)